MMRLSKYIAIYILENRDELEGFIENINKTKAKMPDYNWLDELIEMDVIEVFYRHLNTDIMVLDTILHHLHLKDITLRDKTYTVIAYYKDIHISFFTGLMAPKGDNETIKSIKRILNQNNINFDKMDIFQVSHKDDTTYVNEAIYISFLSIEKEIDRIKVKKLNMVFPDGYVENSIDIK